MLEIAGLRFLNSYYLYLLALTLVVFLWRLAIKRKKGLRSELFPESAATSSGGTGSRLSSVWADLWRYVFFTLILAILILALAQPQLRREQLVEDRVGIDTVLILDLSYSMLAEDIAPSRLGKAREVIRDFIIRKRPEDRIGLVIFAETSLILSYLTRDPENLLFYLDFMEPLYGTNIGRAAKSGLRVFEREDEIKASDNSAAPSSRIMVLLSDGEDHGHELEEALAQASQLNVKIYSIGIGSRRAVPIPVGVRESGLRSYLQTEDGNQVYTHFAEKTLRHVSEQTGARFYRAFVGYEMERAFQDILQKERTIKDYKLSTHFQDLYYLLLVGSLGMFFLLLLTA